MSDNIQSKNEPKRHHVLQGALLACFGAALGFGGTGLAVLPQITQNTSNIAHVKESVTQLRVEQEYERKRTDARVFEVVALMKELLITNHELMVQNRETMAVLRERKMP